MKDISLIYTTFPSKEEAENNAKFVIKEKLAACTHIFPVTSHYEWEGDLQSTEEYIMRAKTLVVKEEELLEAIQSRHSYEVPMLQVTKCRVIPGYYKWMKETLESEEEAAI